MLTELEEIPGGVFRMGSTSFYPEEAPIHSVEVAPFALERHPVTNAQFAEFVAVTGYVTVAEQDLDPAYAAEPGALVFTPTDGPVDLRDWRQWWRWVPGAHWRAPLGPHSSVDEKPDHPVVQVAYPDAAAYARWAGRRLPTEAEWEYAARAGAASTYPWGDEEKPGGVLMANTWQGAFPYRNDGARGWSGTSPVGAFPSSSWGLLDMIGNVWEWTTTEFCGYHRLQDHPAPPTSCCAPTGPADPAVQRGSTEESRHWDRRIDPAVQRGSTEESRHWDRRIDPGISQALKGGSHLCAPEYCHRYRAAARSPQSQDTATSHIGFRCVADR